ncbi:MAG: AraC family transcriptional regulator [Anaerovoracaceae bacterium]
MGKMKNFVIPNLTKPDANELSPYLIESIQAFSDITMIPVTFLNNSNEIIKEFNKEEKICNLFEIYTEKDGICQASLSSAGQFSSRLGEPYIFLCRAGLANISISLILEGQCVGHFVAGPLVMGELRESITHKFASLNNLSDAASSMAKMFAGKMPIYQPNQVSQIALLFYNSVITSVNVSNDYTMLRNQYKEQTKINSDIQKYKKEHINMDYPYDLENVLIANVIEGQVEKAKECIENLIEKISILEAGDLPAIKAKILWLFAIVIRLATEKQSNLSEILDADLDVIIKLSEAKDYHTLVSISISLIEKITKNMLSSIYKGQSIIISKSLQYIGKHYKDKITLKDIEQNLHVNPSYFSTLFKQEMGSTFTEYLNSIKVDYACELLADTNLSIIDISLATGFEDQSYFTKVFKKCRNVTPKEYRNNSSGYIKEK